MYGQVRSQSLLHRILHYAIKEKCAKVLSVIIIGFNEKFHSGMLGTPVNRHMANLIIFAANGFKMVLQLTAYPVKPF